MFARPKNWIAGGLWKPKNPHSLEHLKYLYNVLGKNQTVTEQNKGLLVETLRSISEILIWGDQNDSSVFDFFLEKNMLSFFLRFMRQKSGRYICVQLLQTLNILFENISNETSVYYLLSNNHINSIIVHKFDFSDEEVMAYYISFLKTLSLKLNKHTIHFFYNEHTNDFALYTEAIKFFNHPETMVRIAVRTITLNVFKACRYTAKLDSQGQPLVDEKSMLRYIRDKTAAPYFSNLVWFIGNHVLELDVCVRHDIDHSSRGRLSDLVAEHLDHLHYLNDILCLNIDALNEVLTDHLLNRLLIPLYVYSLTKRHKYAPRSDEHPHVSSVVSLFLLSQVFLIMHHTPLVMQLADIILNGDESVCELVPTDSPKTGRARNQGFKKPLEPLAQTLDQVCGPARGKRRKGRKKDGKKDGDRRDKSSSSSSERVKPEVTEVAAEVTADPGSHEAAAVAASKDRESEAHVHEGNSTFYNAEEATEVTEDGKEGTDAGKEATTDTVTTEASTDGATATPQTADTDPAVTTATTDPAIVQNSTDEEKLLQTLSCRTRTEAEFSLTNRPYLSAIFNSLDCLDNDYMALFSLCLLYAMGHNNGIHQEILDSILMPTQASPTKDHYNISLIEKMINILSNSCQNGSRVRLATLELSILLLTAMVYGDGHCYLQDRHLAALEGAREEATLQLRNFYKVWEKSEEIFLDMFEDEYREMKSRPLNVEYLTMDASILLPPTGTPLTGIAFNKRLPCGEVERARRAIRVFFHLREISLTLRQETETQLPLTKLEECVSEGDVLDLNNSDLIACTVITKENRKERRFLVIDVLQLILVEPDSRRLGWGVVKFVGFLQDVEVTGDKEDSRSLHITIHKPATNMHARPIPLLCARFLFDDHIRCMAAKQRLTKGRLRARQRKMQMIARLLELPGHIVESMYQPASGVTSAATLRTSNSTGAIPGRSHPVQRTASLDHPPLGQTHSEGLHRSLFSSVEASPAFTAAWDGPRTRTRIANTIPRAKVPGGAARQESTPEAHARQQSTPEAHARVSLNHSRSSSTDSAHSSNLEIPMEDLSGARRPSPRRLSNPRVASVSPRRGSSGSPRGRSRIPVSRSSSRDGKNEPPPGNTEVTSFIKDSPKQKRHTRKLSAGQPKSLTPATEPALSLVMTSESRQSEHMIGSPKLVPPTSCDEATNGETDGSKPPLQLTTNSEATVSESDVTATADRGQ